MQFPVWLFHKNFYSFLFPISVNQAGKKIESKTHFFMLQIEFSFEIE